MAQLVNHWEDGYDQDELEWLLEHPEELETGCEYCCDGCVSEEIKLIKNALTKLNDNRTNI